ncbi:MAG: hypothetical protein LBV45_00985 [Xanthomonadaceae bacterium]|nr:hypothetical protein [Xanthomonadaceae bacterium]
MTVALLMWCGTAWSRASMAGMPGRVASDAASHPSWEGDSEDKRSTSDKVRWFQRSMPGVQILGVEEIPYEGRVIVRVKYLDDQGRVRYVDDPGPTRDGRPRGHREQRGNDNGS